MRVFYCRANTYFPLRGFAENILRVSDSTDTLWTMLDTFLHWRRTAELLTPGNSSLARNLDDHEMCAWYANDLNESIFARWFFKMRTTRGYLWKHLQSYWFWLRPWHWPLQHRRLGLRAMWMKNGTLILSNAWWKRKLYWGFWDNWPIRCRASRQRHLYKSQIQSVNGFQIRGETDLTQPHQNSSQSGGDS